MKLIKSQSDDLQQVLDSEKQAIDQVKDLLSKGKFEEASLGLDDISFRFREEITLSAGELALRSKKKVSL